MVNKTLSYVAGTALAVASLAGYTGACNSADNVKQTRTTETATVKPDNSRTPEKLMDILEIKVNNGNTFRLEYQGNGLFKGRNDKLTGSEVVEIYYDFLNSKTRGKLTIEGSLFTPKQEYELSEKALIDQGKYEARSGNKTIGLSIESRAFLSPEAKFIDQLMRGMADSSAGF